MGKVKRERTASENEADLSKVESSSYKDLVQFISPIASPLAGKKLAKRLYKCTRKAQKEKMLRKGVREVQKFIRKGESGIVVIAGDTNPIDVICHMPLVCEEKNIPYCYTPSKEDLGAACGSKRPTCMVMIKEHSDYKDIYDEIKDGISSLPLPVA
ncbi:H/ACA ribonucleoprotein complex subunit 2-like protein [Lineus longissimus]|uniref:H/ACA ribonucleoprotein complex subunit 2-like protein n=1 Tax=Lineus longissimus TaxID=88925 RepID=UPI002B4C5281